jgi:transposase
LLISCKPDRLSDEEQLWLKHIFQEPQVEKLYGIVQHFIEIICDRLADKFEPWVQDALAINISAVSSFVGGLKKDYSAIHAALIYPWSNGQVEGQVNRLKLINRQMYGRASFELLKARVLP